MATPPPGFFSKDDIAGLRGPLLPITVVRHRHFKLSRPNRPTEKLKCPALMAPHGPTDVMAPVFVRTMEVYENCLLKFNNGYRLRIMDYMLERYPHIEPLAAEISSDKLSRPMPHEIKFEATMEELRELAAWLRLLAITEPSPRRW